MKEITQHFWFRSNWCVRILIFENSTWEAIDNSLLSLVSLIVIAWLVECFVLLFAHDERGFPALYFKKKGKLHAKLFSSLRAIHAAEDIAAQARLRRLAVAPPRALGVTISPLPSFEHAISLLQTIDVRQ
jgi:hypothetical protein